MVLYLANGENFATGATPFTYRPATERETTNRIFLTVQVETIRIEAVVDTGAPFVILAPTVAQFISFHPSQALSQEKLLIRGMVLEGNLTRMNFNLPALVGADLDVNATVFVPNSEEQWGDLPSFIGLSGFLERIRFAIDPNTDTFYFGAL